MENLAFGIGLAISIFIGLLFLLVPAIVAVKRKHKNKTAIVFATVIWIVVSVFLPIFIGLIGWCLLTVWALLENGK